MIYKHVFFTILFTDATCVIQTALSPLLMSDVRHWAHSTNLFLWYWLMTLYITENLISFFSQMWDTLPWIKFAKSTIIRVSLSFMSTLLPGSSSEYHFYETPTRLSIIVCLTSSKDWYMTQRKFLECPFLNVVIWRRLESWFPLRYQVYLVTTINIISGNHESGITLCFDHVNEKWMIIWVQCWAGFLFMPQLVHSVTVHCYYS